MIDIEKPGPKKYNDPDDPGIVQKYLQQAQNQDQALSSSNLADSVELNLNLSWNQAIEETQTAPWYDKLGKEIGLAALSELLDKVFPFLGAVGAGTLDFLLPDGYTKDVVIKQLN